MPIMYFQSHCFFFPDVLEEFYIFEGIMDPYKTLVRVKIKIQGNDRMLSKL